MQHSQFGRSWSIFCLDTSQGRFKKNLIMCPLPRERGKRIRPLAGASHQIWRARRDLNPRPSAPEANGAMPPRQIGASEESCYRFAAGLEGSRPRREATWRPLILYSKKLHTLASGALASTSKGKYLSPRGPSVTPWSYAAFHADFRHLARSGFLQIPPFRTTGKQRPACHIEVKYYLT